MTTVMATGVFDLLHLGHIHFLAEARKLGDRLVVVVAHDETATRRKRRPINGASVRAEIIGALRVVDDVVIGDPQDFMVTVAKVEPEIIALGYDQRFKETDLEDQLAGAGYAAKIVRVTYLAGENHATRVLLAKLKEGVRAKEDT